jgi:hypothetical protein
MRSPKSVSVFLVYLPESINVESDRISNRLTELTVPVLDLRDDLFKLFDLFLFVVDGRFHTRIVSEYERRVHLGFLCVSFSNWKSGVCRAAR